jgi:NDP-sugar pyrophosphorylase family protein
MPIVDDAGRLLDLSHLTDLVPARHWSHQAEVSEDVRAVVLAGGRGQRLGSLTEAMPKPMLPVGDRPLLETLVVQLASQGVRRITIAVHYLAEAITSHFGDGSAFGVEIDYLHEDEPMGTAGAIRHAARSPGAPLLVLNADILTTLRFAGLLAHHRRRGNSLTVAVTAIDQTMPFGVLELAGMDVVGIEEKPAHRYFVSAGIYVVSPEVLEHVDPAARVDMPDVISAAIAAGCRVGGFPLLEFWSDIGHPDDYDSAQLEYERHFGSLRERGDR